MNGEINSSRIEALKRFSYAQEAALFARYGTDHRLRTADLLQIAARGGDDLFAGDDQALLEALDALGALGHQAIDTEVDVASPVELRPEDPYTARELETVRNALLLTPAAEGERALMLRAVDAKTWKEIGEDLGVRPNVASDKAKRAAAVFSAEILGGKLVGCGEFDQILPKVIFGNCPDRLRAKDQARIEECVAHSKECAQCDAVYTRLARALEVGRAFLAPLDRPEFERPGPYVPPAAAPISASVPPPAAELADETPFDEPDLGAGQDEFADEVEALAGAEFYEPESAQTTPFFATAEVSDAVGPATYEEPQAAPGQPDVELDNYEPAPKQADRTSDPAPEQGGLETDQPVPAPLDAAALATAIVVALESRDEAQRARQRAAGAEPEPAASLAAAEPEPTDEPPEDLFDGPVLVDASEKHEACSTQDADVDEAEQDDAELTADPGDEVKSSKKPRGAEGRVVVSIQERQEARALKATEGNANPELVEEAEFPRPMGVVPLATAPSDAALAAGAAAASRFAGALPDEENPYLRRPQTEDKEGVERRRSVLAIAAALIVALAIAGAALAPSGKDATPKSGMAGVTQTEASGVKADSAKARKARAKAKRERKRRARRTAPQRQQTQAVVREVPAPAPAQPASSNVDDGSMEFAPEAGS